jgi:hypothetical protein
MTISKKKMALAIASSIATLLLVDSLCHFAFSYPHLLPSGVPLLVLRGIYMNNRDFIQYNGECARYDARLTYTLRPGSCKFSNAEFDTRVFVNRRGLRDDDASLRQPEIIVLGDSHAMGWGVEESEAFPSILEKRLKMRVLNAAISSYGTAREVEKVLQLDHASAKVLIVQYCGNDFEENQAFVANNYKLTPMKENVYKNTVRDIAISGYYLPGQHLARTFEVQIFHRLARTVVGPDRLPNPTGPAPRAESVDYSAELFMKILKHSQLLMGRRLVFVLAIDAFETRNDFPKAVWRQVAQDNLSNLRIVDLSGDLRPEYYFRLDDHINRLGHRLVADRLFEEICNYGDDSLRRGCAVKVPASASR